MLLCFARMGSFHDFHCLYAFILSCLISCYVMLFVLLSTVRIHLWSYLAHILESTSQIPILSRIRKRNIYMQWQRRVQEYDRVHGYVMVCAWIFSIDTKSGIARESCEM